MVTHQVVEGRISPGRQTPESRHYSTWLSGRWTPCGPHVSLSKASKILIPRIPTQTLKGCSPSPMCTAFLIYSPSKNYKSFWPRLMACGILVPPPEIKPHTLALSPNHWTASKFPKRGFFFFFKKITKQRDHCGKPEQTQGAAKYWLSFPFPVSSLVRKY